MDSRGLRKLKAYLGHDATRRVAAKRARDVVPVLAKRHRDFTTAPSAASPAARDGKKETAAAPAGGRGGPLSEATMAHLAAHLSSGAARRLSRIQLRLIEDVTQATTIAAPENHPSNSSSQSELTPAQLLIRRAAMKTATEIVDTICIAALERGSQALSSTDAASATSPATGPVEGGSVFLLVEDPAAARKAVAEAEERYGLTTLLLDDEAPRYPTFPLPPANTPKKTKAVTPPPLSPPTDKASDMLPSISAAVALVVATPAGFIAVDRRSAIWKFIGCFLVALQSTPAKSPLLQQLRDVATADAVEGAARRLNGQRWGCLGHAAAIAILATNAAALQAPELDLLTTLRLEPSEPSSQQSDTTPAKRAAAESSAAPPPCPSLAPPLSRAPVVVHYTKAEGAGRFQYLFSLIAALSPRRGLVVHTATKEAAVFLSDVLYAMADSMPPHVALFADYEGASQYTGMHTAADRHRLCTAFDATILGRGDASKSSAVLLSCYGLVPSGGNIFLQYDILPDALNFNSFVADRLSPAAYATAVVRRDTAVQQRRRSQSPTPAPKQQKTKSKSAAASSEASSEARDSAAVSCGANYQHILLLLRPNEIKGLMKLIKGPGAARYAIEYRELPSRSEGRYRLIGEKLKSLNKKLFTIQNAAYHAYKATMTAYCTIGPRAVYNEEKVNLDKVAEEFGYVELPLLDLRLKDTPFRKKEDYLKAARKKQQSDRRASRKFAAEYIIGEEPEDHVVEE